jgi:hypothetical protein
MTTMTKDFHSEAIRLNLTIMCTHLDRAARLVDEALTYMRDGEQRTAIGTLIELPDKLEMAHALYGAIVAIHRNSQ